MSLTAPILLVAPRYRVLAVAALIAAVALPAPAAERGQGAHEHGVGQLNLAVEGATVEIEITAPGADIAGFEHAPETAADRQAVAAAVARLKDAAALFRFPAKAGCTAEDVEVESPLMEGRRGHEKEHGHDNAHGAETHAEFRAHYHFSCSDPAALTHIDLGYFQAFPAARELEARTITARGQGARELTAERSRLTF